VRTVIVLAALVRFRSKEQECMPDEVVSDGFAIRARPVGTHAVLVDDNKQAARLPGSCARSG
jgi:hypothetical protein